MFNTKEKINTQEATNNAVVAELEKLVNYSSGKMSKDLEIFYSNHVGKNCIINNVLYLTNSGLVKKTTSHVRGLSGKLAKDNIISESIIPVPAADYSSLVKDYSLNSVSITSIIEKFISVYNK
jgi:hypothetical protein